MENVDVQQLQAFNWNSIFIDILILGIMLCVGIIHWKRGLYNSFMPLVVIIISLGIGMAGASIFTDPIMGTVQPLIERNVNQKLATMEEQAADIGADYKSPQDVLGEEVNRLINSLNLKSEYQQAYEAGQDIVEKANEDLLASTLIVAYKVLQCIIFAVFAGIGFLVFTLIKNFVGKVSDWPVIHLVDSLGGFLLGMLEAFIVLMVFIRVCGLFGVDTFQYYAEGTKLLSLLTGQPVDQIINDYLSQGADLINNAGGSDLVDQAGQAIDDTVNGLQDQLN